MEAFKDFKNDLYNFCDQEKLQNKKNVITQEYANGGLKMVSFTDFIAALKATRIRRILHSNANWTELLSSELNIIIYNLWIFGIDYINNLTVNNQKVLDRCFKVVQRKKKI